MPERDKEKDIKKYSYKSSGVDIDKASNVLSQLKKTIASTFSDKVLSDLSSFSGLFQLDLRGYKNPVLTSSTDGVGTKIILAKRLDHYESIGQDAVAMCINDIICCGAKPLFFLDYIACGKVDNRKIKTIIKSIAKSCSYCDTVLIGGETAEHPGMSEEDDIDVAGFTVGIIEKSAIINPHLVKRGDIIAGLASSGIHSNGFSLVRKLIEDKQLDLNEKHDWAGGESLGNTFLTPTRLYSVVVGKMIENKVKIHGIAHITGGGFYENINRIIPGNMDALINEGNWRVPAVFKFLQELGNIDRDEMFRVFNMGIGMVLVTAPDEFDRMRNIARDMGEKLYNIGIVTKGSGKVIIKESQDLNG
ncbi:MAG: phosphoribosylformylglycinamidine cyclo-ligase [Actinomycetota bacterium]|nr:phosphoribosylformylglycinamidine cyclo-ligase [Actinomycetota bacterium]